MGSRVIDPAVEVIGLTKRYGAVTALDGVDLAIRSGAYFILLGPSGGGKTTLLRAIGGFIRPNTGTVRLAGADVTGLPPNKRPTGMVFQSYALFPHMTVAANVGYGLKLRGLGRGEIDREVASALDQVGLSGYGGRRVWELSGGQQQRVQLARALILKPRILLLDEPLAALDAKLRKDMCYELKHLQEAVGITFVHVTHNQEEAMTVGDEIALIADGRIIEAGKPRAIYERPQRRFTADFIGENNILDGRVTAVAADVATVETPHGTAMAALGDTLPEAGASASVSVRSECAQITSSKPNGGPAIAGRYRESVYLGLVVLHEVSLPEGGDMRIRQIAGDDGAATAWRPGQPVFVTWSPKDARLHLD